MDERLIIEIKKQMLEKKIRAADIAKALGVSNQMISAYLTGERNLLTGTAKKLLNYLGLQLTVKEKEQ